MRLSGRALMLVLKLQFFHDRLDKLGVGVPFSAPVLDLGKKELREGGAQGEPQGGRQQPPCQREP